MITAILNVLAAVVSALPKLIEQIAAASRARAAAKVEAAKNSRNEAAIANATPPSPPAQ
jgi:hypothetical protein